MSTEMIADGHVSFGSEGSSVAKSTAIKNLTAWANKFPKMLVDAVNLTTLQAEQQAKRTTAFKDRTGRLRNSIQGGLVSIEGGQIVGALTAGKNDAAPGKGGYWVAASMEYAPHVEIGTSKMAPHAFIWPAMQSVRNKRILERAVKAQFDRSKP